MHKKLTVILVTAALLLGCLTGAVAAGIINIDGVLSAFSDRKEYTINDTVTFTVKTGTDITRVKLVNEDGTTYLLCDTDDGFKNYTDDGNIRTWKITKKIQFFGPTTKRVFAGSCLGYSTQIALVTFTSSETIVEPSTTLKGFVRAKGNTLVDGDGEENEYQIKGMAFGNNIWANPALPVPNHHTEESYKELSDLGFNSVRFYLNYALFEDDSAPYIYKQSGWDYLDENINMAKKYGIRLILNMHYPQGGYQSLGTGTALWTNPENQRRLTALWKAIAERYCNEIAIGGYDLVNEPIVPRLATREESIKQWKNLAQTITDEIRKVDRNHLIMVERVNAMINLETGEQNWESDADMNFFLIEDDNTAYEFHNYDPFTFTHQNADFAGLSGKFAVYPDDSAVQTFGELEWTDSTLSNPKADTSSEEWQRLEGQRFIVDNESFKAAQVALQCMNLGENGKAWIDDVTVKEYNENGEYVRDIYTFDFTENPEFSFWSNNSVGSLSYDAENGNTENGCLCVAGTTDDANAGYPKLFIPKQGYSYEISGSVKLSGVQSGAVVKLRVDFWNCDEVTTTDKRYLEKSITNFLDWGTRNNVPLYFGEFGADCYAFEENRGGGQWVEDILGICMQYKINFNYHTYHEKNFGLYGNDSTRLPGNLNQPLFETFKKMLADAKEEPSAFSGQ